MNPYEPVDQTDVAVEGLSIGPIVDNIREQGYSVAENFLDPYLLKSIRDAFNTEVPITEMRAIGTQSGRTWRAHNLLAKTRAVDSVFLDQRLRAIVAGVIGKLNQVNITTLFNTLPGETKQSLIGEARDELFVISIEVGFLSFHGSLRSNRTCGIARWSFWN